MERSIRLARKAAWGDDSGIKGIPGIDGVATAPPPAPTQEEGAVALNRRQKRQQERESKKEKDSSKSRGNRPSRTSTPMEVDVASGPQGTRKRVHAENGKVLVVDSVGNVFLEEEDENGGKREYLLDPSEVPEPTVRQTLLFRLPMWTYSRIRYRLTKQLPRATGQKEDEAEVTTGNDNLSTDSKSSTNGLTRKRGKRNRKMN